MSYVDRHLNSGERVVHRTTLHPIIFVAGGLLAVLSFALFLVAGFVGGVILLISLVILGAAWLRYANSEFAVTSSRVVIKVGLLSRRTLELQLSKVEAIAVDQNLVARLMDYGTLVVSGTGGTKEAFRYIKAPLTFRGAVQHQTEISSRIVIAPIPASIPTAQAAETRHERDCPYCAERILAKATRCRFCGQTVAPVA